MMGGRSFFSNAPTRSFNCFKKLLKTYVFGAAFNYNLTVVVVIVGIVLFLLLLFYIIVAP